ncbi:MAG: hypothetical protein JW729_04700 [Bacteroidales bacterium]|nr:hypothetical protein [Bacteroidales bacterium]
MILNYKTGKLPPNFIYLGALLFGIGIWRMIELDWKGILFFVLSLLFLFLKSGILIDGENKRLKKYTGIFGLTNGKWKSIQSASYLQIIQTKETQNMSVLSITRTETNVVYKLFLSLSKQKIELMTGEKEEILARAEKIATLLQIPTKNKTTKQSNTNKN